MIRDKSHEWCSSEAHASIQILIHEHSATYCRPICLLQQASLMQSIQAFPFSYSFIIELSMRQQSCCRPRSASAAAEDQCCEVSSSLKNPQVLIGSAPEPESPILRRVQREDISKLQIGRGLHQGSSDGAHVPHKILNRKPLGLTPLPLPLSPAHRHVSSPSSTSSTSSFQRNLRYPNLLSSTQLNSAFGVANLK